MKIALATVADFASGGEHGKLNIMGIFDNINAKEFPTVHGSMALVLRLHVESRDGEKDHAIRVRLLKPGGGNVFDVAGNLSVGTMETGQERHVNHVMNLQNITFEESGTYYFLIYLNGREAAKLPLKLIKRA